MDVASSYDLSMRRLLGRATLFAYRIAQRVTGKGFSLLAGGAFADFGSGTVLQPPLRLAGEHGISIGDGVWIGPGSWLQSIGPSRSVTLRIGDGTSAAGNCVLSAAHSVTLGRRVLLARGVYVSDHSHRFDDVPRPVLEQGLDRVAAVEIGDGAWLGENVVVCPGVRIGRGSVVGANAVVTSDVPDFCLAVGAPARVVRRFAADIAAAS